MNRKPVTSAQAPLYINEFPPEVLSAKGALGMTMAPGKKCNSMTALWDRDLDEDLDRLRNFYKTDVLVSLMEDFEFDGMKISQIREKCEEKGIKNIRFEIVDGSVPVESKVEEYVELAKGLKRDLEEGRNVVIHCMGGLGRTGTLAACILILFGVGFKEAIDLTRKYRKGAIETEIQEKFIERFKKLIDG